MAEGGKRGSRPSCVLQDEKLCQISMCSRSGGRGGGGVLNCAAAAGFTQRRADAGQGGRDAWWPARALAIAGAEVCTLQRQLGKRRPQWGRPARGERGGRDPDSQHLFSACRRAGRPAGRSTAQGSPLEAVRCLLRTQPIATGAKALQDVGLVGQGMPSHVEKGFRAGALRRSTTGLLAHFVRVTGRSSPRSSDRSGPARTARCPV